MALKLQPLKEPLESDPEALSPLCPCSTSPYVFESSVMYDHDGGEEQDVATAVAANPTASAQTVAAVGPKTNLF